MCDKIIQSVNLFEVIMSTEMKTSNLIIKTIVVLLIITLFITSVFMVFLPGKVSVVASDLGMEKLSIAFEKANYEKSGDINSLATILNYEIYNENFEEIAEYGMEMLNHQYYEAYVVFLGSSSLTSMGYDAFIETYILEALYEMEMQDTAIAVLSNRLSKGYEDFGVGIILCGVVSDAGDSEFASQMLDLYESNLVGASDIKQYNIILEALMISSGSEYEMWAERLETLNEKFA